MYLGFRVQSYIKMFSLQNIFGVKVFCRLNILVLFAPVLVQSVQRVEQIWVKSVQCAEHLLWRKTGIALLVSDGFYRVHARCLACWEITETDADDGADDEADHYSPHRYRGGEAKQQVGGG